MFFDVNSDGKIDKNEFKNFLDDLQLTPNSSLTNVFALETKQWITQFEKMYSEKYSTMIKDEVILAQKKNYLTSQWEHLYLKCFPERDSYKVLSHGLLREMLISICLVLSFQERKMKVAKDFPNFNLISTLKVSLNQKQEFNKNNHMEVQKYFLTKKINDILEDAQASSPKNKTQRPQVLDRKKFVVDNKKTPVFNYNQFLISKFLYKEKEPKRTATISKQPDKIRPVPSSTVNANKENNCSNLSERVKTKVPFFVSQKTQIKNPVKKVFWDNSKKQISQIQLKGLKSFMK
jgi:hypothetical protein